MSNSRAAETVAERSLKVMLDWDVFFDLVGKWGPQAAGYLGGEERQSARDIAQNLDKACKLAISTHVIQQAASGITQAPPEFPWKICPICEHEWSRHDPEDGRCDAGPPCQCGRNLEAMQCRIAELSRAALHQGMPTSQPESLGMLRISDQTQDAKEVELAQAARQIAKEIGNMERFNFHGRNLPPTAIQDIVTRCLQRESGGGKHEQ